MFETILAYCLSMPEAEETYPFDMDTRVFKVRGKMFGLLPASGESISLKCDPAMAIVLREAYLGIAPGYHLNKQHWNTITLDGNIDEKMLMEMVDDSFLLVVKGLRRADRDEILHQLQKG